MDFVRAGYPDWVHSHYAQMFDIAKVQIMDRPLNWKIIVLGFFVTTFI